MHRQFFPIVWVPKQASASHEEYWRFALAQAQKQAKPLAFRQGGKSSLGIVDGAPDSFPHAPRARVWEVADVPKYWGEDDGRDFLSDVKWHVDEVLARRKPRTKHARPVWIVKATPPPDAQAPLLLL